MPDSTICAPDGKTGYPFFGRKGLRGSLTPDLPQAALAL
jgi:hypothetical protein